jgi:hypothetical protein
VFAVGRYDALTAKLSSDVSESLELSFDDIDEIVGGLPPSARKHSAWWSNGQSSHQSKYWTAAQRRAKPDLKKKVVRFERADDVADIVAISKERASKVEDAPLVTTHRPVALNVSGEHLRTVVSFEWQSAGEARERAGKLEMPQLPPRPGIFRFRIEHAEGDVSFYVGATENLFRQMGSLRSVPVSQAKDVPITETLARALRTGGRIEVEVVTAALCSGDALDFDTPYARALVESLVVNELRRSNSVIEKG